MPSLSMPNVPAFGAVAAAVVLLSACKGASESCDPVAPQCSTGSLPTLSIADVTVTEGVGGTVDAVFGVTLSQASPVTVTVQYGTSNGTAASPDDFQATSGTLTFAPRDIALQVTVPVVSDILAEMAEMFTVALTSPTNATIADSSATGLITDDDLCTPSGTISPGERVSDMLEATDCTSSTSTDYFDMWVWTQPDSGVIAIDLTSQALDFDPFLTFSELDGTGSLGDDDGGYDANSRLVVAVPPGTFVLAAGATSAAGEVGDYDLSLTEVPVNAQVFGSSQMGGGAASLHTIDITDGGSGLVGPIGFDRVGAMSFHPTTDVLYAVGERPADGVEVLISIDHTTGTGTEVGPTGHVGGVAGMAFRPDGTLFLYTTVHDLYTANLSTGSATLVGATGNPLVGGNGVAFDAAGVLYHSNPTESHTLNTSTGLASYLADMSFPSPCVDFVAEARVSGVDRPAGLDEFYGIVKCDAGVPEAYLAQIDFATGHVSIIARSQDSLDGFAILD